MKYVFYLGAWLGIIGMAIMPTETLNKTQATALLLLFLAFVVLTVLSAILLIQARRKK